MRAYDYIIVGAGPSGLTLAWVLAQHGGYRIALVDREKVIGGCHRVRRVGGPRHIFTEHGPRIYVMNYLSTKILFKSMGIDFDGSFVPYKFFFNNIATSVIGELTWGERFAFAFAFLKFMVNPEPSKTTTVLEFMLKNNFTENGLDFIERICKLTDGAGAERYTLWELFEMFNQNAFYSILQPKHPNDKGFILQWEQALLKTRKVDFFLNTKVVGLGSDQAGKIDYITTEHIDGNRTKIRGNNIILAIPPINLVEILKNSPSQAVQGSFGNLNDLRNYAIDTEYNTYIPVTLHWKKKIKIPPKWGYPSGPWELAVLVLSDYMDLSGAYYPTLISTCISDTNRKSERTGKTANQSSESEIKAEVLAEIKRLYQGIPDPDLILISPEVYFDQKSKSWKSLDKAFILTPSGFFGGPKSPNFDNLYSVGTHNGYSPNSFTSMESAVTNALYLLHQLVPSSKTKFPILKPYTLKDFIISVLVIVSLAFLIIRR